MGASPSETPVGIRSESLGVFEKRRGVPIIEDIDLAVRPGTLVSIIGSSGSGKSTLLRALGINLPGRVAGVEGRLFLEHEGGVGEVADQYSEDDYRELLSFVPQGDVFVGKLTVAETLHDACIFAGLNEEPRSRAKSLMRDVGLDGATADLWVEQLSGGQRRRLAIARALASKPQILLLDEPTSGLDLPVAHAVMQLLADLRDSAGLTVICTSHLPSTLTVCDRVLVLAPGEGETGGYVAADLDQEAFTDTLASDPDGAELYAIRGRAEIPLPERPPPREMPAAPDRIALQWQQFSTVATSSFQAWYRDRWAVVVFLIQPLLLAAVVVTTQALHGGGADKFVDFFLCVSALWIGMSLSVRAIVDERACYALDELSGLSTNSYLSAKMAVLSALALAGVLLLLISSILLVWLADLAPDLDLESLRRRFGISEAVPRFLILSLAGVSGVALGLIVSALAPSGRTAVYAMPLLILPQVVFSKFASGYSTKLSESDGFPYQALHTFDSLGKNSLECINFFTSLLMTTRHASSTLEGLARKVFYWKDFACLVALVAISFALFFCVFRMTKHTARNRIR